MMHTSSNGISFIKRWEGLVTKAYRDIAGIWTIGYGHTAGFRDGRFNKSTTLSNKEAELLLRADLASREDTVRRLVRVSLNQNEFDALVSFEFNTGALHRSTALKLLNARNRPAAAEALTWWNKARIGEQLTEVPGLTRRRAAEAELFLRAVQQANVVKPEDAQKKTPAKRRRLCLSFAAPKKDASE